jgi:hypothetical protein
VLLTLFGAKENRDDMEKPADKVSFKLIADTIFGNDQLRWMVLDALSPTPRTRFEFSCSPPVTEKITATGSALPL